MSTKRVLFLDIIRIIACFCILVIHFNAQMSGFWFAGKFVYNNNILPSSYFNVYLGSIGVGLFFIISGAALELNYPFVEISKEWLLNFYKKRFMSLYPMYWIGYIFCFIIFIKHIPHAPIWHFIFTVLGVDGYLLALGLPYGEFYKIGEWFLGCIILLYLIYPFLSYALHRNRWLTIIIVGIINYILINKVSDFFFILQLPYFIFGMFFVELYNNNKEVICTNISIVMLLILLQFGNKFSAWTQAFFINCALFSVLAYICKISDFYLQNYCKLLGYFSRLTYPFFLVHHILIYTFCKCLRIGPVRYRTLFCYFVIYLLVILISGSILVFFTNKVNDVIKQKVNNWSIPVINKKRV